MSLEPCFLCFSVIYDIKIYTNFPFFLMLTNLGCADWHNSHNFFLKNRPHYRHMTISISLLRLVLLTMNSLRLKKEKPKRKGLRRLYLKTLLQCHNVQYTKTHCNAPQCNTTIQFKYNIIHKPFFNLLMLELYIFFFVHSLFLVFISLACTIVLGSQCVENWVVTDKIKLEPCVTLIWPCIQ